MKKLLIAVVCFFALQTANAQVTGGVKLGLSTNDITQGDIATFRDNTDSLTLALANAGYGFHIGAFVRIPVTKLFYVQVDPMLSSSRFEYSLDSISATGVIGDLRTDYESFLNLDIPVMVGVQFKLPADISARAHAGVVGSVVLSSQSDLINIDGYTQQWDAMRFGYMLGVGADLGAFTVDLNFNGSLAQFGNDITIGNQNFQFDTRPSSTVVTVGYKLFGK